MTSAASKTHTPCPENPAARGRAMQAATVEPPLPLCRVAPSPAKRDIHVGGSSPTRSARSVPLARAAHTTGRLRTVVQPQTRPSTHQRVARGSPLCGWGTIAARTSGAGRQAQQRPWYRLIIHHQPPPYPHVHSGKAYEMACVRNNRHAAAAIASADWRLRNRPAAALP